MKYPIFLVLLLSLSACAGHKGDVGSAGSPGLEGRDGATGPAGHDGAVGHTGADGTVITMVKFCPQPPVYPSTFPEFGMVINGSVYGVYSTNGGFLALLPPGAYLSNGVGSTCNFTINANNTISH